jgi:hypothetical protein
LFSFLQKKKKIPCRVITCGVRFVLAATLIKREWVKLEDLFVHMSPEQDTTMLAEHNEFSKAIRDQVRCIMIIGLFNCFW